MRKSFVILIIASILLVSFVESKKQIRKLNPEETQDVPILVENELETSQGSPTYYTKDNAACFKACSDTYGNSFMYYKYQRYLCCSLGLSSNGDGWYWMSCYPFVLNCQGN